ncbi:uncharacterized protein SOCE836_001410 [Sorangium cellulosum]|uniref:Uncharacterized protein n=1 Tax=Sorangium cellulosum TaxID=56 RepID=A0A4P2QFR4_SORCE|nr:uncharacterized protein SOCE836_001410 [Sorangium cellulosum]WCQ87476.1 hypothetical protein NQZ70_00139 [Sorangium sp. Soce836]
MSRAAQRASAIALADIPAAVAPPPIDIATRAP